MTQEKEETLHQLGLSPIQARVYLTLVRSGRLNAKTLAKYSNVARPDIYRIMNNFMNLGIVHKVISNPVMFEITPIEHALPMLMEHKVEEIKQTQKKTKSLIKELQQRKNLKNNNVPESDPDLFLIPATKASLQKRNDLSLKAQVSIEIISTWQHYKVLLKSGLTDYMKSAIKRNVKYRIIIETPKQAKWPLEHQEALKILGKNGSGLRYISTEPSAVLSIYDKHEVLLMMSPTAGPPSSPFLWSNYNSIVSISSNYFENLWRISTIKPNA